MALAVRTAAPSADLTLGVEFGGFGIGSSHAAGGIASRVEEPSLCRARLKRRTQNVQPRSILISGNGGCLTFAGPGFLLKTTGTPPHMSAGIRAISLRAFYEKVKDGKLSANAAAIEAKKRAERERSSKTDNITLKAGPSAGAHCTSSLHKARVPFNSGQPRINDFYFGGTPRLRSITLSSSAPRRPQKEVIQNQNNKMTTAPIEPYTLS